MPEEVNAVILTLALPALQTLLITRFKDEGAAPQATHDWYIELGGTDRVRYENSTAIEAAYQSGYLPASCPEWLVA